MKPVRLLAHILIVFLALPLAGCSVLLRSPLGPELQLTPTPLVQPVAVQPTQPPAAEPAATQLPAAEPAQPQPTQPPAAEPAATQPPAAQPAQPQPTQLPAVQPAATQPPAAQPVCGGQGIMDLLILGQADPATPGQRGADAIRLVHLDFDQPAASNLSLPPDLLAGQTTLTQAYWNALQIAQGEDPARHQQATQALAQTLLDNYGYAPDHYIDLNQPAFAEIIDLLGGIQVDVPETITDVPEGWHTFQAGPQTLTGDQVRDYVRLLNPTGQYYTSEWDRFSRQNQVIFAVLTATFDPANWDKLPALITASRDLLVTDLSLDQLLSLSCILKEVGDQTQFLELPLDSAATDDQGRIIVDPDLVRSLIAELQQ